MDRFRINISANNNHISRRFFKKNKNNQILIDDKISTDYDEYTTNPAPQDARYIFNWEDFLNENKIQTLNYLN